jgi:glycosyltransferase involved in cell wall biosynthesis
MVRHDTALGVAHARNRGIAESSGQYGSCLDADDMMEPGFLEYMVAAMDQDPKLGLAYSGLRIMNADGSKSPATHSWPNQYDPKLGMYGNQVPTLNMFRRQTWQRLGGYRQRFAPHGAGLEDGDFWCRILAHGQSARKVISKGLFLYRVHPKSATRTYPADWQKMTYYEWYPWHGNDRHPLASQLDVPPLGSWAVRDYDRPRIAVVVPVGPYHRQHMINALDSVEAQTYRFWELIVVNDTGEPLDLSAWPFARVIDTEKGEMGPGHARNLGTASARAPLVAYLDADDILQPTFLEETLRVWLDAGGWIYTDFFYITDEGTHRSWKAPEWEPERLWDKGLCAITCLYPIQAWDDVGGFDEEIPHEDWDFHIKLVLAGWCGTRLPKPLITYRHDTGKRREQCIEDKGFIRIKKRYTKESLMGCRCGRGGGRTGVRAAARAPVAARQQAPPNALEGLDPSKLPSSPGDGYVLMVYVGKSSTDLFFHGGRSGQTYIFSTKRRLNWVHPMDAGRMSRKSVLRIVDLEALQHRAPALRTMA